MTQTARLIEYLRHNPGATPMQLITELRLPKYTARISDARAAGHVIEHTRDDAGVTHYRLVEHPVQTSLAP